MVANRCNLDANQVFKWRRLIREPMRAAWSGGFSPVAVGRHRTPRPVPWRCARFRAGLAGMACERCDGHASRHEHAGTAGSAGPRARCSCRGSLRFPRTQRRFSQNFVARRPGDIALRQASGAWPVSVANGVWRGGIDQRGAARPPVGRDRVAQSGADLAAVAGRLRRFEQPGAIAIAGRQRI